MGSTIATARLTLPRRLSNLLSMRLSRILALTVGVFMLPLESFAQDDFLVPLTPEAPKPKKKRRVKRPAATEPAEEDVLAPLVAKTELAVKVNGNLAARLFVDGNEVATLPSEPVEVEPGERLIIVRRPGYADAVRRLDVKEGQRAEVTLTLDAIAGVLNVVADAAGARVSVDGKDEGPTPLKEHLLVPGRHEVRVSAPGHVTEKSRLLVRAGREYNIAAKLRPGPDAVASTDRPERTDLEPEEEAFEPEPLVIAAAPAPAAVSAGPTQWYQRWYVWAGGAAVVGAIAGGIAVATQPPNLFSDPGALVCGGTCDGVLGTPGFRR